MSKVLESASPPHVAPQFGGYLAKSLSEMRQDITHCSGKKRLGAPGTRTDRIYEWGIGFAYCELVTVTIERFRRELDRADVYHMRNRKIGKHKVSGRDAWCHALHDNSKMSKSACLDAGLLYMGS